MADITDQQKAASEESARAEAIRSLAQTLNNGPVDCGCKLVKGVVTAYSYPYLSAQLGGDTSTTITSIRHLESYSPVVGDTAHFLMQGSDILALGRLNTTTGSPALNGWVAPTLGTGITSPFDTVRYRMVNDSGDRKVQIRGKIAVSGTNIGIFTLPVGFRPTLDLELLAARNITGGSVAVQVTISTAGSVSLFGVTTGLKDAQYLSGSPRTGLQSSIPNTGTSSISVTGNTDVNHTHFSSDNGSYVSGTWTSQINTGFTNHNHSMSHIHAGGDHQHYMDLVDHPTSVNLNGLEFFL